jgi:hypothetical protein
VGAGEEEFGHYRAGSEGDVIKVGDVSRAIVRQMAASLRQLREKVVFPGGTTTGFLIPDEPAPGMRATKDVDVSRDFAQIYCE